MKNLIKWNLSSKKMIEWMTNRTKAKYKNNYNILPKDNLINLYDAFVNYNRILYNEETKLNSYIGRITNFPDYLSENIVMHILSKNSKYSNITGKGVGDIHFILDSKEIYGEVKCKVNGPSSFSPKKMKNNDHLFYIDASTHMKDYKIKVYHIPNCKTLCENIKINEKETFNDQQDQKRRPRTSNIENIIKNNKKQCELIYNDSIYNIWKS